MTAALGGTLLLSRTPPAGHRHGAVAGSAATSPAPGTWAAGGTGSASPAPGACLVGRWKGVAEDIPVHIDNQPVQYIGRGADQLYRADGTSRMDYGRRTVYRVAVNGNKWTYIVTGSATLDWQVRGSTLYNSDVRPHGHWVLLENGAYNNSGPLSIDSKPGPYSCTATTLRIYQSNGGPVVLSRVQPKPSQAASGQTPARAHPARFVMTAGAVIAGRGGRWRAMVVRAGAGLDGNCMGLGAVAMRAPFPEMAWIGSF